MGNFSFFLILLVAVCLVFGSDAVGDLRTQHAHHLSLARASPLQEFKKWAVVHGKAYLNDIAEYERRFQTWLSNLEYIFHYNSKTSSHWLHLNSLADLTEEEYKQRYLGFNYPEYKRIRSALREDPQNPAVTGRPSARLPGSRYASVPVEKLPTSIDWRDHNAVTHVKNQGQCGSCWSFSATGSVEGANALFTKELISVSEQELVDCDRVQNQGCSGGLMDIAFDFIVNNHGIDTEEDYPYVAVDNECDEAKRARHVVTIDGYEDVQPNEVDLKRAVAHQPVSVAIEADAKSFQLYGGGVYDDIGCGTELNHGVLAVGYGVDNVTGVPYWIVKNSWGAEWGDTGYIRIKMGGGAVEGLCGIALVASYAVKTHPNPPTPPPAPPTPPGPAPIQCDSSSSCAAGTTCCCVTKLFNQCFVWGCCPMPHATCCGDGQHCCPQEFPVCDSDGERCIRKIGSGPLESCPWSKKRMNTITTSPIQALANYVAQWWDEQDEEGRMSAVSAMEKILAEGNKGEGSSFAAAKEDSDSMTKEGRRRRAGRVQEKGTAAF